MTVVQPEVSIPLCGHEVLGWRNHSSKSKSTRQSWVQEYARTCCRVEWHAAYGRLQENEVNMEAVLPEEALNRDRSGYFLLFH